MFQPSVQCGGEGTPFSFPGGAPAFTQAETFSISWFESEASFAKCPQHGSANQGGILRVAMARKISIAQGLVSAKVTSEKGAISPGRWQDWRCRSSIGATSR